MTRYGRTVAAAALLVAVTGTAACAERAPIPDSAPTGAAPLAADLVPAQFAGLTATVEDITAQEKEAGPRSYATSTRLWSLREGTRLRATLQVGRLAADAFASRDPEAVADFERAIVSQIGQVAPRWRLLGGRGVYVTASDQQPLYVWFTGSGLFVLSVAKDYQEPRRLLREALELRP